MIPAAAIAACVLALVVVYMRRQNFRTVRLSAARFVDQLTAAHQAHTRWQWTAPIRSRWFWLRAAILSCLFVSLIVDDWLIPSQSNQQLGIRIVVDTSYSMSTILNGRSRFGIAIEKAEAVLKHADRFRDEADVCVIGTAVDLDVRNLGPVRLGDLSARGLTPRPVGGNAVLLRNAAKTLSETCPITHAVVISDLPAPILTGSDNTQPKVPIVWLNVGAPAFNLGISDVRAYHAPLSGHVNRIWVEVQAYGGAHDSPAISVRGPSGQDTPVQLISERPNVWAASFVPPAPGIYKVMVRPGGAYDGDDHAVISLAQERDFRVRWRLTELQRPQVDGWKDASTTPGASLLVAPFSNLANNQLTERFVAVAGRYRPKSNRNIGYFVEGSPILEGVNLDVLERYSPSGFPALSDDFSPVVIGADGNVWMAVRYQPRAAIVPPPMPDTDVDLRNLSLVVFFNALKWVLNDRMARLDARLETPSGQLVTNGFGEGNTGRMPRSDGLIETLTPVSATEQRLPVWPWLILFATLLLAVERTLAAGWRRGRP